MDVNCRRTSRYDFDLKGAVSCQILRSSLKGEMDQILWRTMGYATSYDVGIPWVQIQILPAPLSVQIPANVPWKAEGNSPNAWTLKTPWGGPDRSPSAWFNPGPVPTVVTIWKVNQYMEDLSLSRSLAHSLFYFLCNTAFQINKIGVKNLQRANSSTWKDAVVTENQHSWAAWSSDGQIFLLINIECNSF